MNAGGQASSKEERRDRFALAGFAMKIEDGHVGKSAVQPREVES